MIPASKKNQVKETTQGDGFQVALFADCWPEDENLVSYFFFEFFFLKISSGLRAPSLFSINTAVVIRELVRSERESLGFSRSKACL